MLIEDYGIAIKIRLSGEVISVEEFKRRILEKQRILPWDMLYNASYLNSQDPRIKDAYGEILDFIYEFYHVSN